MVQSIKNMGGRARRAETLFRLNYLLCTVLSLIPFRLRKSLTWDCSQNGIRSKDQPLRGLPAFAGTGSGQNK